MGRYDSVVDGEPRRERLEEGPNGSEGDPSSPGEAERVRGRLEVDEGYPSGAVVAAATAASSQKDGEDMGKEDDRGWEGGSSSDMVCWTCRLRTCVGLDGEHQVTRRPYGLCHRLR